jgi:hypothetical protein
VKALTEEELRRASLDKFQLIDLMLDPFHYRPTLFSLVVNTYMWYMTDRELFEYLLAKFTGVPEYMSPTEESNFVETVLKNLRFKIISFLKEWYKKFKDLILTCENLQTIFAEVLLTIYQETSDKAWMIKNLEFVLQCKNKESFRVILESRFQELLGREKKIDYKLKNLACEITLNLQQATEKLYKKFDLFLTVLKNDPIRLAEEVSMFDFENFENLLPNELLVSNWNKGQKKELSPNIVYISEVFNRLSKLLTLYIITAKDKKSMVRRTDEVIQLTDNLILVNNFNSAYAVHLAVSNIWLKNYREVAGVEISSRARPAYEKQKVLFSVNHCQYRLQQEQFRAPFPSIPFLGLYLQQIVFVCERKHTFEKDGSLNVGKFWDIEKILQKITLMKEFPYKFKHSPELQLMLKGIPPTDCSEAIIRFQYDHLMKSYENK